MKNIKLVPNKETIRVNYFFVQHNLPVEMRLSSAPEEQNMYKKDSICLVCSRGTNKKAIGANEASLQKISIEHAPQLPHIF